MTQHDTRLAAAYPHLLPGFFDLTTQGWSVPTHRPRRAWPDLSEASPPADRRRGSRAYRRLWADYAEECAAACSILFQFCDAVQAGDSVIVTAALSA